MGSRKVAKQGAVGAHLAVCKHVPCLQGIFLTRCL